MRSIRIRTLMILVAVAALLMGSIGPGLRWHRRWSVHRSRAATYAHFEKLERLRENREQILSVDREAIRATLRNTPDFDTKSPVDQDRAIDAVVMFHRLQSKEARLAAARCEENRRECETAAFWSWDPFAPDVR
jgi:hypothetical protein